MRGVPGRHAIQRSQAALQVSRSDEAGSRFFTKGYDRRMSLGAWGAAMPAAAMLLVVLAGVLVLCVRAPVYAFAVSLVLFTFEGTVKVLLHVDGAASPAVIGAAAIDFALFASLARWCSRTAGARRPASGRRRRRSSVGLAMAFGGWLCCPSSSSRSAATWSTRSRACGSLSRMSWWRWAGCAGRSAGQDRLRASCSRDPLAVAYAALRGSSGRPRGARLLRAAHPQRQLRRPRPRHRLVHRRDGHGQLPRARGVLCLSLALLGVGRRAVDARPVRARDDRLVASYVRSAPFAVVLGGRC